MTTITPTQITQPGYVAEMPEDAYHADPVPGGSLSASMAKILIKPGGPARLRHQLDHGRPPKREFDFGHAAHMLVLGEGAPIAVIPADILASNGAASTTAAKAFIEKARAAGQVPLKPAEAQQVADMADELTRHAEASALLTAPGVQCEMSAFAIDPQTGVWLRGRFDFLAPGQGVGDYKTAADGEPGRFARRTMLDLGYHVQAAHYLDLAAAVGLTDPDAPFRFVVQEKTAPYLVSVVTVGDDYLQLGRRDMRRAIDLWARCQTTGVWPGYPSITAEPPRWAVDDMFSELDPSIEDEFAALLNH